MPADYLHNHPQFAALIRIVAREKGIDPALGGKPTFDEVLKEIKAWASKL